jgi:anti-sigma regulatory factor (Ser/Thr protein kinase)
MDGGTFSSEVLVDGAEMRSAIDGLDWSKTPLGHPDEWSPALKTMVRVLLANRFPLLLWWGPSYVCIYNGAYRPILGTKHPWALGRPVKEVWHEIWPVLQPLIDTPFRGGPATWNDDLFLEINRDGFVEETHFTVAYSPVPDESVPGGIGGVLATVHEITDKVVADRRVALLRDLAARSIDAKTTQEACEIAGSGLAAHPRDIPFALLYLVAPDQQTAHLVATTGVEASGQTVPAVLPLESASPWPLAETMRSEALKTVSGLAGRFGGQTPLGPWSDPPHTAVVVPIRSNRPQGPAGFLIAGISPRLALDDAYLDFLKLVSSQISTSIVGARQHEEEKARADAPALLEAHGRVSQAAADTLAGRRRAEELAQLSTALQPARNLQAIVDGTFAWLHDVLGAHVVMLSVVEGDQAMLRMYFSGTAVPLPVVARYLRTPLHEHTHSAQAVRDGVPRWFEDFDSHAREFPDLAGDLKASAVEALAVLPFRLASGLPFAALAIGWDRPLHFDTELITTLNNLAAVVAGPAQRGQLAELEHSEMQRLENDLLGIDTRATGVIVRARHQGADAGINVGGDWYDAVDIGDGRVAVAVGDVVGRGLDATKTAVRLRGALGLAAFDIQGPAEALTVLDRYSKTVQSALGTTVALAVVDPARAVASYACAGHPPPLLVSPNGDVAYLNDGRSWPLGLEVVRPRAQAGQAPFPPGSLLLLYTDGLIERRGESLDVGLDRLLQVVTDHWNLPLRRLKQAVFQHLVGYGARDDVALVAVRGAGACQDLFSDAFTATRDQQLGARQRLRDWLEGTGLPGEERDAIVLSIGEAVANAIDHGSDGDPSQIVTVELARVGSALVASVGDRGHWQPGLRALLTGRGRGHLIMEALADDVDISLDQGGTVVTLQFGREAQLV